MKQSPCRNLNSNRALCPVDFEITEGAANHIFDGRNSSPYRAALERLVRDPLLDRSDNWRGAFDRAAMDDRGLNAALRDGLGAQRPLPWKIIDRGVVQAGTLFEDNHPAWMSRVAFFGQCYDVMGAEAEQRRMLSNRFSRCALYKNADHQALMGLSSHVFGVYLAQTDRLTADDWNKDPGRRKLAEDIITGAASLYRAHQRRACLEEDPMSFAGARNMFDNTIQKLERIVVVPFE